MNASADTTTQLIEIGADLRDQMGKLNLILQRRTDEYRERTHILQSERRTARQILESVDARLNVSGCGVEIVAHIDLAPSRSGAGSVGAAGSVPTRTDPAAAGGES